MKFLRVIRFDASDDRVFERAAVADEWAVSGAFEFAHVEDGEIKGKLRQAFANGFLGLSGFGRSTFAHVVEMTGEEEAWISQCLAQHFMDVYGAPSIEAAVPAATGEVEFVKELCAGKPLNTVFTVRRTIDANGDILEEFREISPPSQSSSHTKVWEIVNDEA